MGGYPGICFVIIHWAVYLCWCTFLCVLTSVKKKQLFSQLSRVSINMTNVGCLSPFSFPAGRQMTQSGVGRLIQERQIKIYKTLNVLYWRTESNLVKFNGNQYAGVAKGHSAVTSGRCASGRLVMKKLSDFSWLQTWSESTVYLAFGKTNKQTNPNPIRMKQKLQHNARFQYRCHIRSQEVNEPTDSCTIQIIPVLWAFGHGGLVLRWA